MQIENINAEDLSRMLSADEVMLIDVREKAEFSGEHIHGAQSFPLSQLDPKALPDPLNKKIVFMCAGGVRSARAVSACHSEGLAYSAHLLDVIAAWKSAGLPTER